jgi:hypothetical protein
MSPPVAAQMSAIALMNEISPGRPAVCQARRYRRTDRSVTRSSAAISAAGTRYSNLATAASRTCSRRLRSSAVKPPLAHTAYVLRTAGIRTCQPSGHRELKTCKSCTRHNVSRSGN